MFFLEILLFIESVSNVFLQCLHAMKKLIVLLVGETD